ESSGVYVHVADAVRRIGPRHPDPAAQIARDVQHSTARHVTNHWIDVAWALVDVGRRDGHGERTFLGADDSRVEPEREEDERRATNHRIPPATYGSDRRLTVLAEPEHGMPRNPRESRFRET